MAVEQPPIKDQGLAAYLVRAFTALQSSIDSVKTFFVLGEVKNPQAGKLYFVKNATSQLPTDGLYFYNGTTFVKLTDASSAVKLGVSHADAYYGDLGKVAYDHSNKIGNPHGLTTKDIGLEKVNNTSDKDKPISDATQAAINGFVPANRRINGQTLMSDVTLGTGNVNETFNRYYVSYSQKLLVTYSANSTTDGYLLGSDWAIFNSKQDALGFTPENVSNKVIAWSSPTNAQYPSAKLVDDTFALYVPLSSFHDYYKGLHPTLAALNIAYPTATAGDYAQVDSGVGFDPETYYWDASDSHWVLNSSSGSGAVNTDGLPEGSTNKYFTEARVRTTLLTGFSSSAGTVGSTDSILVAFNKIVGNFNTPSSYPTLNQSTTGSAAKLTTARTIDGVSFNGTANITTIAEATQAATSKTVPVDADEVGIVDSAASNVLKKLTWANLKATLKTYFDTLYLSSWSTWTPTWTNIAIGNAVVSGRFLQDKNKLVIATLDVTFGTTSSATTTGGTLHSFTLPVNVASRISVAIFGKGQAYTTQSFVPVAQYKSASDVYLGFESVVATLPAISFTPVGWTNGYKLSLTLMYEAA